jgi:hypothetical protein
VPAPELLPQPAPVHQQVVRGLPFDALHHSARSQVRGHAQQQVHMIGPYVAR